MANGNGNVVTWRVIAATLGALLIGVLAYVSTDALRRVTDNAAEIRSLDKRVLAIEQAQDDILALQKQILEELRKGDRR